MKISNARNKKVVHYDRLLEPVVLGEGVWLIPVDHTNHFWGQNVTNGERCFTSNVQAYDPETGHIETYYSYYVPVSEELEEACA